MGTVGAAKYPYDPANTIPFGPDGQKNLATRLALMNGAGIGIVADKAGRDKLVTDGDAFPGLVVYQADVDVYFERRAAKWVMLFGATPGARLTKSSAQNTNATAGSNLAVLWDVETYDPFGMHDLSANTQRLVIPPEGDGFYSIKAKVRYNNATTASTITSFAKNGTNQPETMMHATATGTYNPTSNISDDVYLIAGDYIEVVTNSSIGSVALVVAQCVFSAQFLHP
jgi:hypothetical protein